MCMHLSCCTAVICATAKRGHREDLRYCAMLCCTARFSYFLKIVPTRLMTALNFNASTPPRMATHLLSPPSIEDVRATGLTGFAKSATFALAVLRNRDPGYAPPAKHTSDNRLVKFKSAVHNLLKGRVFIRKGGAGYHTAKVKPDADVEYDEASTIFRLKPQLVRCARCFELRCAADVLRKADTHRLRPPPLWRRRRRWRQAHPRRRQMRCSCRTLGSECVNLRSSHASKPLTTRAVAHHRRLLLYQERLRRLVTRWVGAAPRRAPLAVSPRRRAAARRLPPPTGEPPVGASEAAAAGLLAALRTRRSLRRSSCSSRSSRRK